jgi:ADP-heptose:LPS heptosyltransferase
MQRQMRTAIGSTLTLLERLLRGSRVLDPASVAQVLVLEYQLPLGCCVHLTPVFEALKICRPELRVAVATRGLGAAVLRHSPFVDEIIQTQSPLNHLPGAARQLRSELRRRKFRPDCVLTGVADQRTKISLLGLLAASGWRGGYTQMPALYRLPLERDPHLTHIENNLELARLLGCMATQLEPRVYFGAQDAVAAETLLREANPADRPLVAIVTQSSGGQRTGWHTERFVEVIRALAKRGYAVVYPGTERDKAAIQAIRTAADGCGTSIAGRTSLPQLAAALALSDAVLSLDTGTMHVGRAVDVPMVVLGPSWQRPTEWMPLGKPNARILRGPDRDEIPAGYQLDEIEATAVIAAFDELMAVYPPSAEAREARRARSLSEVDHLNASQLAS